MERTKIGLLVAKLESTYNGSTTFAAASNSIAVANGSVNLAPEFDPQDRQILDGRDAQAYPGEMALPRAKISFRLEARGNRTDGTTADISKGAVAQALRIDCLLRACDLTPTYTAETSTGARDGNVVYKPTVPADNGESVALQFYSGSKRHLLTGCKGTVKAVFEAGKCGLLDFDFMGIYNAPADAALPGSIAFEETKPPLCIGNTLTLDSWTAPVCKKLEFDLGNQIVRRDDMLQATGVQGFFVGTRATAGSVVIENVAEATYPLHANLAAGNTKLLNYTLGSLTGNKLAVIFNYIRSKSLAYEDQGGIRNANLGFDVMRATLGQAASEFALYFS